MDLDFIHQLENDDEVLAVLSGLGFCFKDWSFLKKIGSLITFIRTDFMKKLIEEKLSFFPYLILGLKDLRKGLDIFYEEGGYFITPFSKISSRLFKPSVSPLAFYGFHAQAFVDKTPAVAIIGSRAASHDALLFTKKLAEALAFREIHVVSGGAMGVDEMAHFSALKAHGSTTVVAGTVCTFKKNPLKNRYGAFSKSLAIIYPFGPFIPQGKFMFVERNRYVASLADAVVVVQGKRGSGTLYTASFAKAMNIPLFAPPNAWNDPLSYAPNYLLEKGDAKALTDIDQFAESLKKSKSKKILDKNNIKEKVETESHILQIIRDSSQGVTMDELIALTGCSFIELQKELLNFELEGCLIKRGAQFVLTGN